MRYPRSTHHYRGIRDAQVPLRMRLRELATCRVRYGYRRLHVLLRREGWAINAKRVYHLYRLERLALRPGAPIGRVYGRSDLARHWRLRLERARQETDRAARQYQACEPENRLVGRELERRWEESLRSLRQLEGEYERWRRTASGRLSPDDERAIRSLAGDLPAVWHAATTTPAERQRVVRLLVERVIAVVDKASERVDVELHWAGDLTESHVLSRPVRRYELRSDYRRLVASLKEWSSEGLSAAEIAERLNREGFRPPKRVDRFNRGMVQRLLGRLGPAHRKPQVDRSGLAEDEYRPSGLARRLGIALDTVRRWVRAGWVTSSRDAAGYHVIWADASELTRLRELHALPRTWATRALLTELSRPKPRPRR
jgi:hypothetical protein